LQKQRDGMHYVNKFFICWFLLGLLCAPVNAQTPVPENTNAVLISKYMALSGNEAHLITDKDEIKKFVRLFQNNKKIYPHACGYHWLIWFQSSPTAATAIAHNQECETYQRSNKVVHRTLKTYFDKIKTAPAYFITNIKIPASLSPQEIVKEFADGKELVVFFNGLNDRLPRIKLEVKSVSDIPKDKRQWEKANKQTETDAINRLQKQINELKSRYQVIDATQPQMSRSSFGDGKIESIVQSTIYFEYGFQVDEIKVSEDGLNITEKKTPADYIVQIVGDENFSNAFKQRLMSQHKSILEAFAYPKVN
jgi:hypothetical protein